MRKMRCPSTNLHKSNAMFHSIRFYFTTSRYVGYTQLDKKWIRICGDYLYEDHFEADTELGCSDAISLGMLSVRQPYYRVVSDLDIEEAAFYKSCFDSVCNGLNISLSNVHPRVFDMCSPLTNLIRVRAKILDFGDEFEGVLFGDPWFFGSRKQYRKMSYVGDVDRAKEWYHEVSNSLIVEGIQTIDTAICKILGWDSHATVRFGDLVGYPNIQDGWDKFSRI